jgi:hypothetical protein
MAFRQEFNVSPSQGRQIMRTYLPPILLRWVSNRRPIALACCGAGHRLDRCRARKIGIGPQDLRKYSIRSPHTSNFLLDKDASIISIKKIEFRKENAKVGELTHLVVRRGENLINNSTSFRRVGVAREVKERSVSAAIINFRVSRVLNLGLPRAKRLRPKEPR